LSFSGAFLTTRPEAQMAFDAAYSDILAAFDEFVAEIPKDMPIIIAGDAGAREPHLRIGIGAGLDRLGLHELSRGHEGCGKNLLRKQAVGRESCDNQEDDRRDQVQELAGQDSLRGGAGARAHAGLRGAYRNRLRLLPAKCCPRADCANAAFARLMAARAGASRWGMSVDSKTVKKIASLARIAMTDAEVEAMVPEFNGILGWVEQLGEVDVTGVEPMTAVIPNTLRLREDVVTDGNIRDKVLANAPAAEHGFFGVPKVIE
jgi:aspartyl-tRNA(Asn)/glutamyl-tRNA(Gln) amidotransferase subunit C